MLNIEKYRSENPISTRLLGLILFLSGFVACVTIGLQLYFSFHDDVSMLDQRLEQVRISTLPSISKSLWGFDEEQLSIQVNSLLELEDVEMVSVAWRDWNNQQQRLTVSSDLLKREFPKGEIRDLVGGFSKRYLVKELPLEYVDEDGSSQLLGTLYLTASLAHVYSKLWERATFIASIHGGKTLILAFVILYYIRRLLTRHIESIALYARTLTLDDLSVELSLPNKQKISEGRDELDNVTDAINQMRESLIDDIERRQEVELALLKKMQEQEISKREQEEAESANRAKSQFLATMSHEIRTPMNGVLGMVELLKGTPLNETQNHYIDVINRSGKSLINIINDILDYSKIEAGKMELESTEFDLGVLLDDCMHLFTGQARSKNIALMSHASPFTPQRVLGDQSRLRQILVNLISNAFKFTDSGFVLIEATLEFNATTADELVIQFAVHDSGIGIPQEVQKKLFDSFRQADSSTTRQYGGTGLGLSISKRLVELMDGEVAVASEVGKGSSFWFTVKLGVAETLDSDLPNFVKKNRCPALEGKQMLIIGGNEIFNTILVFHSYSWGLESYSFNTAERDFNFTNSIVDKPDFVLIDEDIGEKAVSEISTYFASKTDYSTRIILAKTEKAKTDLNLDKHKNIESVISKPFSPNSIKEALIGSTDLFVVSDHGLSETSEENEAPAFSHLSILVAEDNMVNQMVIRGMLSKLNVDPTIVSNGEEALLSREKLKGKVDLILMDCEMPKMDGFESTKRIRAWEKETDTKPVEIVALTAHALQEHADLAFESGMNEVLHKPLEIDQLVNLLRKI